MAVLSVTATSVAAGSAAVVKSATAAATITAGQAIYKDTTTTVDLADADVLATAVAVGIALNGGAVGQPIAYQESGQINLGATLVVGEIYSVSVTAGGIENEAALGSGDFPTILGIAISTALLELNIQAGGIAKP